jgi:N-acetylmuramic acid 6-phosphate etherase
MEFSLDQLVTEQQNERTRMIDQLSTVQMLELMNDEDQLIAAAVRQALPEIGKAVDAIVNGFKEKGRLFYVGAGTSGRLGIMDASECPPTFGTSPEMVQGIIAGGDIAIRTAVEGVEDDESLGYRDMANCLVGKHDVVVGIAASGRTPYVIGSMKHARAAGAVVICVCNNPNTPMSEHADIAIEAVVGPDTVLGSTRLKAGTSQKMILNMLTTASMIRMGKVYGNLMVDLRASNSKLAHRAKRMLRIATGASDKKLDHALNVTNGDVKIAIVMLATNSPYDCARRLLDEAGGFVREAFHLGAKEKEI